MKTIQIQIKWNTVTHTHKYQHKWKETTSGGKIKKLDKCCKRLEISSVGRLQTGQEENTIKLNEKNKAKKGQLMIK